MKKALITGITGQDGSYLAEFLLEKGYEVHGITRRSSISNTGRIDHMANYGISNIEIIGIDYLTDGQATTCMLAIPYCNPDEEIMVYNIDTYVEPNEMKCEDVSGDGHIPCFHADGDHWSFAKLDENGNVIEVREKQRISDNCTLERITSSRQSFIKGCMRNIILMIAKWKRTRNILHRFVII